MQVSSELLLRVRAVTWEANNIHSYELVAPDGAELPAFTAGAHVDLHLSNGLVRSYSLSNAQDERKRYVVGIQKDAKSRGGSRLIHETLHAGDLIKVSGPRNNFTLDESVAHTILIAGGIGVTPILCMARRLASLGKRWEVHYCARTHADAAFLEDFVALGQVPGGKLHLNFDHEPGGKLLDLGAVVQGAPAGTHFYCCGPLPMLGAFEAATAQCAPACVHLEYFSAKEAPVAAGGFKIVAAKSGKEVVVPEGKTILDALLDAGIDVQYSCMEGVCGSCEVAIVEGKADHRDLVLTKSEQEAGKTMMVCVSGCKGEKLVLDI